MSKTETLAMYLAKLNEEEIEALLLVLFGMQLKAATLNVSAKCE